MGDFAAIVGISGCAIGNRRAFLPMREAARASRFDMVVVTGLTRMSQSQGDLPKMIDRFISRGVRIISVQDRYDNAAKGHKMQAGLSRTIGEAFREIVSEKTYTALESRALQGKPTGASVRRRRA